MARKGTHFVPVEEAPTGRLSDRARELLALSLAGFALYALLCLATFRDAQIDASIPTGDWQNLGGTFGYWLALGFVYVLGYAAFVPFLVLLGYALAMFVGREVDKPVLKTLGAVVCAAMFAILLAGPDGSAGHTAMTPAGYGGAFGANISPRLHFVFGGPGRLLLVCFGALVSLLLVTEWLFSAMLERAVHGIERLWQRATRLAGDGEAVVDDELLDAESVAPRARRRRGADKGKDADADAEGTGEDGKPGKKGDAKAGRRKGGDDEADEDAGKGAAARGRAAAAAAGAAADENDADDDGAAEPAGRRSRRAKAPAAAEDELDEEADAAVDAVADRARARDDATSDTATREGAEPTAPAAPEPPVVLQPAAPPKPAPKPLVVRKPKPKPKARPAQSDLPFDSTYPFPPIDLFREPDHTDSGETSASLTKGGEAITQKLKSFGIEAEVVAASVGPAVTQYELRLAEGIRVNKINSFEADLAAALLAVSVRVVAPIPGKDTIGIEVPNTERQKVFMRDLLDQFGHKEDFAIPLFLGKDVAGNPIVEDLARMPHLLIAGTTGSGKSVCINAILLSILMTRTPGQVKLILVDPKMVELQAYKQVPHLCCDVVTNMKKAPGVLQWAVDEMENRYALLSGAGVNHIRNYNRLGQQELQKRLGREPAPDRVQLPYIVIVIDEFADLMNVAQNEVEESIQRLAQKSRAVGMHVILATQRPSSEVITGIIKANLPCQIAFKVNRRIDSRVILDANGAEKLLGHGDMLYVPPGGGSMLRAQGSFVADEEMQAVVRFLDERGQRPDFLPSLVQTQKGSRKSPADRDELYRDAVEVILGQQRGSATLLQRALSVGYTRATRLLELMEEDGLVGPFVGSKSREVMMTIDEWRAREDAIAAELEAAEEGDGSEDEGEVDGVEVDGDDAADANGEADLGQEAASFAGDAEDDGNGADADGEER